MRLEEINSFLNTSQVHTFYPVTFTDSTEACSTVNVTGGTIQRGGVYSVYMRVLTREPHPKLAIDKSHAIKDYLLKNLKGNVFSSKEVLNIVTDTPEPLMIGEESGLYTVSLNYKILEG